MMDGLNTTTLHLFQDLDRAIYYLLDDGILPDNFIFPLSDEISQLNMLQD